VTELNFDEQIQKLIELSQRLADEDEDRSRPLSDEERLARWLRHVGFGRRYQAPRWDRVVESAHAQLAEYCANLSEHLRRGEGLTLMGGVGTGKTHALSLIAAAARDATVPLSDAPQLRRAVSVAYVFGPELYNALAETRSPDARQRVLEWQEVDLLLLDDADRLYMADFTVARFEAFVEHRHAEMRTTCVALNTSDVFRDSRLTRTVDRWRESMVATVRFGGQSMRGRNGGI